MKFITHVYVSLSICVCELSYVSYLTRSNNRYCYIIINIPYTKLSYVWSIYI